MVTPKPIYIARNLNELNAELNNNYDDLSTLTLKRLRYLCYQAEIEGNQYLNKDGDQERAYLSYGKTLEYLKMMMQSEEYGQTSEEFKRRCKRKQAKYNQNKSALQAELDRRYQSAAVSQRSDHDKFNYNSSSDESDDDNHKRRLRHPTIKRRSQTMTELGKSSAKLTPVVYESFRHLQGARTVTPSRSKWYHNLAVDYSLSQDEEEDTRTNSFKTFESCLTVVTKSPYASKNTSQMRPRNPTPHRSSQVNVDKLPHIRNAKPAVRECVVCITNKPISDFRQILSPTCNHSKRQICTDCVRRNIQTLIKESTLADIRCPELDCDAAFDSDTVRELMKNTKKWNSQYKINLERDQDRTTRICQEKMKNFVRCAHGCGWDCEISNPKVYLLICECCNEKTCVYHKTRWHDGMTCQEYDEKRKTKISKHSHIKRYPDCNISAVKK